MQENFEGGWDCHANRIYIRFSLTKLKIKKKNFKVFGIFKKVCSHEFKGTKFHRNEIAWLPCLIFCFFRRTKFCK